MFELGIKDGCWGRSGEGQSVQGHELSVSNCGGRGVAGVVRDAQRSQAWTGTGTIGLEGSWGHLVEDLAV